MFFQRVNAPETEGNVNVLESRNDESDLSSLIAKAQIRKIENMLLSICIGESSHLDEKEASDCFSAICGGKVYRHMWLGAFKRSHELFLKFVETSEGRTFLKGYPREVYAFALESEAHLNTITDMLLSEMSEHYQKVIKTLNDDRFPKPHF